MHIFKWDHTFETGIDSIDGQHCELVNMVNSLGSLLSTNKVNDEDLENIFHDLVSYTQHHFKEEEDIMEVLDNRHIRIHKQAHLNFLDTLSDLYEGVNCKKQKTSKTLLDFLFNWLVYHILGMDMSMSRQLSAIKQGKTPEEAFNSESSQKDNAVGVLLKSLNNLFHHILEKNKVLSELNHRLEDTVKERTKELSVANRKLHQLATTDSLTGLANRRRAIEALSFLWQEAETKFHPLSCMMIDADNFKEINDTYGHDAGDIVLKELSMTLKHTVHTDDIVCRLGGDEFFIICPNTDETGVLTIASLVHKKVNELKVKAGDGFWAGSISVGVASKTVATKTPEELLKKADLAVYASKEAGKNCVTAASD